MSEVSVNVDLDEVVEVTADDRGRVTLGSEYDGETVALAVLSRDDDDE